MRDRVIDRVRDIVATYEPSSVKPETEEAIRKVLEEAEDRVKESD
jgi:hypothetical protein